MRSKSKGQTSGAISCKNGLPHVLRGANDACDAFSKSI